MRRLSRRRSSRVEEGRFLLDGPKLVAEALAASAPVEVVYAEPDAEPGLRGLLGDAGVPVVEVAAGALAKVLDLANPQSVVAVLPQRSVSLDSVLDAAVQARVPVLALVGIQDPGNAGTLVRVAEAAGCAGVVLTEGSVDPWNPKAVRASAGSLLRVPTCPAVSVEALLGAAARRSGAFPVVATVATGGRAPEEADLASTCIILVGSESRGLPTELEAAASLLVGVPMEGSVESLNAAVSGALVAFEAARQRRARSRSS